MPLEIEPADVYGTGRRNGRNSLLFYQCNWSPGALPVGDNRLAPGNVSGHRTMTSTPGRAQSRECFLPAFEHLGTLPGLTVVDLVVPADLRDAYPCVRFIEGFREAHQHVAEADGSAGAVHAKQFRKAAVGLLRSGMHVLCEKPLLSVNWLAGIAQVTVEAERLLAVNMIRRCYRSFATVERIVGDGQIGRLESIRMSSTVARLRGPRGQ